MLDYYLQHFDTVELNNSFYRLSNPAAFDHWRDVTPQNFVLAVASRFLTHDKKVKDPGNALQNLLPAVRPPRRKARTDLVSTFNQLASERWPARRSSKGLALPAPICL